jgi:hypothetical protein
MRTANPRLETESVRPGFVDCAAHDAIKPFVPNPGAVTNLAGVILGPVIRTASKDHWSPTEPLGKFLTEMAMGKWEGKLSGPGIQTVGSFRIVENVAFRRLMGL